jgi:hypothetical protein
MHTSVELPESIYRRAEESARARGVSVDVLISDVLERELAGETPHRRARQRVSFPIMNSSQPETLDLDDFNFDDLLV